MPTRIPWGGSVVDGEVASDDDFNSFSAGGYARATVTSDVTGITTEADLTGYTVTPTVHAGRLLKITGFVPRVGSDDADDIGSLIIQEDGVQLTEAWVLAGSSVLASGGGTAAFVVALATPSAGSHTYKLRGSKIAGAGTFEFRADAASPGFILVEDIGPSF